MPSNDRLRRIRLLGAIAGAALLAQAAVLRAADPGEGLEVHDVSLWIIDPDGKMANSRSAHPSALPVTVNSVRSVQSSLATRRVAPINLLTFHGRGAAGVDVDLRTNAGSFLAHWPPGDSLPNRLRWSGMPPYSLVEKIEDETELVFADSDDWIAKAREGDALYVKRGARSERFLAYDVELKLDAPVRLEGGPDKFVVINTSGATLYDVLVARATPEGCRVAWIDVLPKSEPSAPEAAPQEGQPPPKSAKPPLNLFSDAPTRARAAAATKDAEAKDAAQRLAQIAAERARIADALAKQAPAAKAADPAAGAVPVPAELQPVDAGAAKEPAAAPDKPAGTGLFGGLTAPKPAPGVEVTLCPPLAADSPDAAAKTTQSLSDRLAKAGLAPSEIKLFVDHYGSLFFEDEALVVACRLDPAAIDEKLPLSIFPMPTRTVRVAMVVVRNADPRLGDEVEKLVAQLGDAKFAVREAAQKRLVELGPLAFGALNQVLNHADLEIVIRAERILLNQQQTPDARAGAVRGRVVAPGVFAPAPVIINR
ncbi:MAG: hypothetical protein WD063_20375 [Pirellulales bacterium]